MDYYLEVLKEEYAEFNGRARRKKYWMFTLVNFIITIVLRLISPVLFGLYGLALFLPSLGVTIRRLHDTNRSGWWILISFVPLIGGIVLLIFLVQDSTPGENKYGLNPKEQRDQNALDSEERLTLETPEVQCKECGKLVTTEADFCSNCGSRLIEEGKQLCPDCESIIEKYIKFCPECGEELGTAESEEEVKNTEEDNES